MRLAGAAAALGMAALLMAPACSAPPQAQSPPGGLEAREHFRRGLELARQGLHEGAAAEFRGYLAEVPKDPDAHFQLARSLLDIALRRRLPLTEVVQELEEALRLDSSLDYVRIQLAEVYGRRYVGTFDPMRAVKLFEDFLKKHPDRYDVRFRFARMIIDSEMRLMRAGDPSRVYQDSAWAMDLARFHFDKVLDMAPRDSDTAIETRTLLGEIQYRMGEWDAARATFEYLITGYTDRKLDLAPAWNTIGHAMWRKGDYKAAVDAFRKAYDLKPGIVYQYDLMLAYDGLGGYTKDLPARYRFPLREEKYDRAAPPYLKFTDIAPRLHVDKYAGAGPNGWADYNGDGRYDLVVCGCDNFCTLYRAEAGGFVDATLEANLGRLEPGFGSAWGDYDNDGDPDLYIARNGWNGPAANGLLRNNGDGTFTDVAAAAGVADPGSSFHCAWFDYDRDGWLDLVVSNGVYADGSTNQLYHNDRDGTFTNATVAAGVGEKPGWGTIGVGLGDYDDDGWPDIFYHGRFTQNRLYHNNGDGTFTDVALVAGVAGAGNENGYIAFLVDFDDDGDLDIWTGSLAAWDQVVAGYRADYRMGPLDDIPRFYRNRGNGTFADESLAVGFRYPLGIMAAGVGDVDNDGYQDIDLGTGNPELRRLEPNIFYHNRGGKTFEDMSRFSGLGVQGKGHGITYIDWDGDGDLDIYKSLGGFYHGDWWHSALFLNELGNKNHWLEVKLSQPERNRDAIGARVTLIAPGMRQAQEVTAGRGFGSTDPPVLHFGLGRATKVDRLEIRWPDGMRQVLENQKADRRMTISRPGPPAPVPPLSPAKR
ncbi:MAG TPA: FG-GAP-like repeat-containing protein [Candidatus Polarisedimenticolia bacterium]|jgi:tetratricopeptide (TPR) repeat protein